MEFAVSQKGKRPKWGVRTTEEPKKNKRFDSPRNRTNVSFFFHRFNGGGGIFSCGFAAAIISSERGLKRAKTVAFSPLTTTSRFYDSFFYTFITFILDFSTFRLGGGLSRRESGNDNHRQ